MTTLEVVHIVVLFFTGWMAGTAIARRDYLLAVYVAVVWSWLVLTGVP